MKVKELIAYLENFDGDFDVCYEAWRDGSKLVYDVRDVIKMEYDGEDIICLG